MADTRGITARQSQKATSASTARKARSEGVWSFVTWLVIGSTILFILFLAYSFFGPSTKQKGKQEAGSSPSQQDPKLESTCVEVPEIPLGQIGDFCALLKGGVPTGRIKPPPHTNVGIYPSGPAEIKFFDDWDDGKLVKTVKTTKEHRRICFPERFTSFTITMEKDDKLRVRIGGRRSPEFSGKCS